MQTSIGVVMVAYLQFLLTEVRSPLPFGAVFSAYHTTRLGYLVSKEFRASITAQGWSFLVKTGFVVFVPFSLVLAAAVGPASAIAMVPRYTSFSVDPFTFGLQKSYDEVYPTVLEAPGDGLMDDFEANTEQSPAIGWQFMSALPRVEQGQATETGFQFGLSDGSQGVFVDYMPPWYSISLPTSMNYSAELEPDDFTRTLYVQYAPNGTLATTQHVPAGVALQRSGEEAVRSPEVLPSHLFCRVEYYRRPAIYQCCLPSEFNHGRK
ncbi:hypothetical protein BDW74DRAFT_19016 [Aspergillus multicolor]|uniref:uncharacterized protein n=1 Tax=Aspergillus multicolor TaxID=41759 RepID=UPI003CCD6550